MTFVAEIFLTVDPLSWEDEIVPFLDVLSCGLIQYPESVLILKNYTVAMLKISMHFPEKFIEYSKDHILDTVIKIYSGFFSNWPFAFSPYDNALSENFWKFDKQNLIRLWQEQPLNIFVNNCLFFIVYRSLLNWYQFVRKHWFRMTDVYLNLFRQKLFIGYSNHWLRLVTGVI